MTEPPTVISNVLRLAKPPSPRTKRAMESSLALSDRPPNGDEIAYQHFLFCQTSLPYRDVRGARDWRRNLGNASLLLNAGEAYDPVARTWVKLGLPFGPKPRLILAYLNTRAILTKSPEIEVGESLTAFVKSLRLNLNGYSIRMLKDQLTRLSAASFNLALPGSPQRPAKHVRMNLVDGFDLRLPKTATQRVTWPARVTLNAAYFDSVTTSAVPLSMRALDGLKNNAFALDLYTWLAQRLWRAPAQAPHWISWDVLLGQFGQGYRQMNWFKRDFRLRLALVLAHYPKARIVEDPNHGFLLYHSPPPTP
jgi:hypothetical protein